MRRGHEHLIQAKLTLILVACHWCTVSKCNHNINAAAFLFIIHHTTWATLNSLASAQWNPGGSGTLPKTYEHHRGCTGGLIKSRHPSVKQTFSNYYPSSCCLVGSTLIILVEWELLCIWNVHRLVPWAITNHGRGFVDRWQHAPLLRWGHTLLSINISSYCVSKTKPLLVSAPP